MINSVTFYEKLLGLKSSLGSILVLLALYFAAYFNNIRLDGVLNLHFTSNVSHQTLATDLSVNLLSLALIFSIALFLINNRFPRLADLVPQLLWAQWPLIPLCFLSFLFDYHTVGSLARETLSEELINMTSSPSFWLATLILIGGIILNIHFYYGLFKVDSGLKGNKLGWAFAVTLFLSFCLSTFTLKIL
tara:strand:+ start:14222 stop:14791 length:570 start_codon:yes stop_codon:yes gene_type:complete